METFFLIIGICFLYGIFSLFYDRHKAEQEWQRFKKESEEEQKAFTEMLLAMPDPWLGMHESQLAECRWGNFYTSYSEITSEDGVRCCYFYNGLGFLHFTNGNLVSIVRQG